MYEKQHSSKSHIGKIFVALFISIFTLSIAHSVRQSLWYKKNVLSYTTPLPTVVPTPIPFYMRPEVKAQITSKTVAAEKHIKLTPQPAAKIEMEGVFDTDPRKKRTVQSLQDLHKLMDLSYAYHFTKDTRYSDKAREYLLAWAKANKPTGNPINESHLQEVFESYPLIITTFSESEKRVVDAWLNDVADKSIKYKLVGATIYNNWNSHRLNVIGSIGYLLQNNDYISYAASQYDFQLMKNMYSDGSTFDFKERDALHYHNYDLLALVRYAKTSDKNGVSILDREASSGASLRKSVEFMLPYARGEKTHEEFVNSTVAYDRQSAKAAGDNGRIGRQFNPANSLEVLQEYYYLEPSVLSVIQKIKNTNAKYPAFPVFFAESQLYSF